MTDINLNLEKIDEEYRVREGGQGSGNFGHSGRPGYVGGSAPDEGGMPEKMNDFDRRMMAGKGGQSRGGAGGGSVSSYHPDPEDVRRGSVPAKKFVDGAQTSDGQKFFSSMGGEQYDMYPTKEALLSGIADMGWDDPAEFESDTGSSIDELVGQWFCLIHDRIYSPDKDTNWELPESYEESAFDRIDREHGIINLFEGGQGSGHFGHKGISGHQGGSADSEGGTEKPTPSTKGTVSYSENSDLYKPDWDVDDGTYVPTQNIKVWIRSKEPHPTNAYYGSSRIYEHDYTEYIATPKDIILKWPGGNFIIRQGSNKREFIAYEDTFKKGAFEKSYGGEGRHIPVGAMKYLGREYGKYSNVGESLDQIDKEHGIINLFEEGIDSV